MSNRTLHDRAIIELPTDDRPIPFLVGVVRSGTTLLRLMLDAHADLAIPPETHFLPRLFSLNSVGDTLREEFLKIVTTSHTWKDFHISEFVFRRTLEQISPFTISAGLGCFYRLYAERFKKRRWGDKTPLYKAYMGEIEKHIPQAHFVHIIRDGRDVAVSLSNLWFGPGSDIKDQAHSWCSGIREARQQAENLKHYMEVRYEDLVTNPQSVLANICEFIDLPYSSQMERYYLSAKDRIEELGDRYKPDGSIFVVKEQRRGIFELTARPPDHSRVGRWRAVMTTDERSQFETIAGDLLSELGYETLERCS